MKLISVIVPVYNASVYLKRCIDSIINNTWSNLEIICVNDGSTDDSLQILKEYEKKDPRIILIDQANGGVSSARNTGIRSATGEFISFIDSDDWVHPQFFQLLMQVQLETNADCVISSFEKTNHYFSPRALKSHTVKIISADIHSVLKNRAARTYAAGRIYRRTLLSNLYFQEGIRLGEDYVFNLTALCRHDSISVVSISEKLYYYFMHEKSAIHTLPYSLFFPAVSCCIIEYERINTGANRKFLLKQACKSYLTARYLSMFDNKNEREIESERKLAKRLLLHLSDLSVTEQCIYLVFIKLPVVYRLYRILKDRTMLKWEKEQKKKAKELCKKEQ